MGVISPVGTGLEKFWKALISGQSGIGPITHFDPDNLPTRIAGEVKDFDPLDYLDRKEAKRMDRFCQFAVATTIMAMEDALLNPKSIDLDRLAVVLGTGIGGTQTFEEQHQFCWKRGWRVSPFVPMMIANMAAGQISIYLGARVLIIQLSVLVRPLPMLLERLIDYYRGAKRIWWLPGERKLL